MKKIVHITMFLMALCQVNHLTATTTSGNNNLTAGIDFSYVRKADGSLLGWGNNDSGQLDEPWLEEGVQAISSGVDHSLALLDNGTVIGWGAPYAQAAADAPYWLENVVAIVAGGSFSLALDSNGMVHAWGENGSGQLDLPEALLETQVIALAAGMEHALALLADGTVIGWGANWEGQADVPEGLGSVIAIAAGESHSLALTQSGTVIGWGANWDNQIEIPYDLDNVVAISAGFFHSLALKADGQVVAWGNDYDGQGSVPPGLNPVEAIVAGGLHNLVLHTDGSLTGWGYNGYGQTDIPPGLNLGSSTGGGGTGGGGTGGGSTVDEDGDGMDDAWELENGLDPFDPYDGGMDNDEDTLDNLTEYQLGINPNNRDSDGDLLDDPIEIELNLSPSNPDTDGDALPDGWEVEQQLDPLFPDALEDFDGDGLNNLEEYQNNGNPLDPDTDGDGLLDGDEVAFGLKIRHPDSDRDGLSDGDELSAGFDPLNIDTDGNGIVDGLEFNDVLRVSLPYESDTYGESSGAALSSDGRFTAFVSENSNLVPNDTNNVTDVFVHDRDTGVVERVSVDSFGNQGNNWSGRVVNSIGLAISGDGRYVAFTSRASNLAAQSGNSSSQIYIHDRLSGATILGSVTSDGLPANGYSSSPSLSEDGRRLAFRSSSSNLVAGIDGNGSNSDVFVHDLDTGETRAVSINPQGITGNYSSDFPVISGDGRYVAFLSDASDLVPNDLNGAASYWQGEDVFRHDLETGQTIRVSVTNDGLENNQPSSYKPSISWNGQYIAFSTSGPLVSDDLNGQLDVYVRDCDAQTTTRVSVRSDGSDTESTSSARGSFSPSISADGQRVAFNSLSWTLDPTDNNHAMDVFIHDMASGETRIVSETGGIEGNSESGRRGMCLSADGTHIAFQSRASNLTKGDKNYSEDIFLKVL